jgi:hypothetical protein
VAIKLVAEGPLGPGDMGSDAVSSQRLVSLWSEDRIRYWTNQRVRAQLKAGRSPGPESSIGKVHQRDLNQRMQEAAADLLGLDPDGEHEDGAGTPERYAAGLPYEVSGMLQSRANTIEGGTSEIKKNVVAERVLGLPRKPPRGATLPGRTFLAADRMRGLDAVNGRTAKRSPISVRSGSAVPCSRGRCWCEEAQRAPRRPSRS